MCVSFIFRLFKIIIINSFNFTFRYYEAHTIHTLDSTWHVNIDNNIRKWHIYDGVCWCQTRYILDTRTHIIRWVHVLHRFTLKICTYLQWTRSIWWWIGCDMCHSKQHLLQRSVRAWNKPNLRRIKSKGWRQGGL